MGRNQIFFKTWNEVGSSSNPLRLLWISIPLGFLPFCSEWLRSTRNVWGRVKYWQETTSRQQLFTATTTHLHQKPMHLSKLERIIIFYWNDADSCCHITTTRKKGPRLDDSSSWTKGIYFLIIFIYFTNKKFKYLDTSITTTMRRQDGKWQDMNKGKEQGNIREWWKWGLYVIFLYVDNTNFLTCELVQTCSAKLVHFPTGAPEESLEISGSNVLSCWCTSGVLN